MSADDVNNLLTVLGVTGLVAVMVFVLPWADRKICGKLKVNLHGGLSENPRADRILAIRYRLLVGGILFYVIVFSWLVIFSRSAMTNYVVHVNPFRDQIDAFQTDHGFSDVFYRFFSEGFSAFNNVELVRPEDLIQFYLNIMVFVPFGYLLPYAFRWFRARVRIRPVLVCFLLSFIVENLQLLTRRGLYDLDDIISNTIGGFIGEYLYISFAYVNTHPKWHKTLRDYHVWRRDARESTLYPLRRSFAIVSRTLLRTSDPDAVMDFYAGKLGYRMVARLRDPDSGKQTILLQLGRNQAEFRYEPGAAVPEQQELIVTAAKIPSILKRLQMNGIEVRTDYEDACSDRRGLVFTGPDDVRITILEEIG